MFSLLSTFLHKCFKITVQADVPLWVVGHLRILLKRDDVPIRTLRVEWRAITFTVFWQTHRAWSSQSTTPRPTVPEKPGN